MVPTAGNLPCAYRCSNLFTADARGNPVWLEAVADLETARRRLIELASTNPGEYFMFDLRIKQIVVSLVSASEESHET